MEARNSYDLLVLAWLLWWMITITGDTDKNTIVIVVQEVNYNKNERLWCKKEWQEMKKCWVNNTSGCMVAVDEFVIMCIMCYTKVYTHFMKKSQVWQVVAS